jgi:hypothetical protein
MANQIAGGSNVWYDIRSGWRLDKDGNDQPWFTSNIRVWWTVGGPATTQKHGAADTPKFEREYTNRFNTEGEAKQWAAKNILGEIMTGDVHRVMWGDVWIYCANEECQELIAQRKNMKVDNNRVCFQSNYEDVARIEYRNLFKDVNIFIPTGNNPHIIITQYREGGLHPQHATGEWIHAKPNGTACCPRCHTDIAELIMDKTGQITCQRNEHPMAGHPMCGQVIAGQNTESSKHDTVKFKTSGRVLGIARKKPLRNVPTPAQLIQFGTRVMAATLPTTKAMLAATHETLTPSNAMTATTTLTSDMYQYMPHAVITIAVLALAMYLSTKCEDPATPTDKKPTYHVQSNRGITPACGEALHNPTAA